MPATRLRHVSALVTAAILATAVLLPVAPAPVEARDGATFISLANRHRADAGAAPVRLHAVVDQISAERANQLAADRALSHDLGYVKDRLAEEDVCWQRLGEIIAYNNRPPSTRIQGFVDQWYHSDGHRAIMLESAYSHAGGSWSTGSNGNHYAVMVFVKLCGATSPPPPPPPASSSDPFTDIASSKFRNDIRWIAAENITYGCTTTRYCPDGLVARDQMASFLRRAMDLSAASKNYFSDIRSNEHAASINSAAEAHVTYGCDGSRYCPSGRVTRAQMASFLSRALDLPRTSRDYFRDDNGSRHEDAINRVAAAGITVGCGPGRYCPNGIVTRGQMAAFLRRSFE